MKRKAKISLSLMAFLLLYISICVSFAYQTYLHSQKSRQETNASLPHVYTVVIDPGHGGEDAGAKSASGVSEKDLNLSVALFLRDKLTEKGISVVLTRDTDILLYDPEKTAVGQKKITDLQTRCQIAEETPSALFVSIHMNAYTSPSAGGFQVWYSPNHPASERVAAALQSSVTAEFQPNNRRKIQRAGSSIYLLEHLDVPAVLIECGFLSNPEEASLLATEEYREQLASVLSETLSDLILSNALDEG